MATRTIFVLAVLFGAGIAFAQAYKWTDENGVVHYSDRPQPGAEEVALPQSEVRRRSRTPGVSRRAESEDETAEPEAPFSYQSFEVANPGPEETLWNIEGLLSVSLDLQPGLQPGHQIRVYFDGQPRMVNGTSFQIEEVWRGVHNIQAEVLDETGQLMQVFPMATRTALALCAALPLVACTPSAEQYDAESYHAPAASVADTSALIPSGWRETVISVSDIAGWQDFYTQTLGWEVRSEGAVSRALLSA